MVIPEKARRQFYLPELWLRLIFAWFQIRTPRIFWLNCNPTWHMKGTMTFASTYLQKQSQLLHLLSIHLCSESPLSQSPLLVNEHQLRLLLGEHSRFWEIYAAMLECLVSLRLTILSIGEVERMPLMNISGSLIWIEPCALDVIYSWHWETS